MQSELTIEQIKQAGNIIVTQSEGYMVTKFGKYTFNYWSEVKPGYWINYDCKTKYY